MSGWIVRSLYGRGASHWELERSALDQMVGWGSSCSQIRVLVFPSPPFIFSSRNLPFPDPAVIVVYSSPLPLPSHVIPVGRASPLVLLSFPSFFSSRLLVFSSLSLPLNSLHTSGFLLLPQVTLPPVIPLHTLRPGVWGRIPLATRRILLLQFYTRHGFILFLFSFVRNENRNFTPRRCLMRIWSLRKLGAS